MNGASWNGTRTASGSRMRVIRRRHVVVYVSDIVYDWRAHLKEVTDKMDELEALIRSIETGKHSECEPQTSSNWDYNGY